MKLAAKLALAARASGYVQKDAANQFHRYKYASAAAILWHVNAALCEHGLAVVDTLPEIVSVEGVGKDRVVTARMTLVVADTESDERATFRGLGSGMDSGDKAVMKAQTAALKYAWMVAFSISTGDDPELEESTDGQERQEQTQTQTQRRAANTQQRRQEPAPTPRVSPARAVATAQPVQLAQPMDVANDPAPAELPAQLEAFYTRVGEIELPGEAVAVWLKHRLDVASLGAADRELAWKALCTRTEVVGKMKNAKVWLKKAIAEEDARRQVGAEGAAS